MKFHGFSLQTQLKMQSTGLRQNDCLSLLRTVERFVTAHQTEPCLQFMLFKSLQAMEKKSFGVNVNIDTTFRCDQWARSFPYPASCWLIWCTNVDSSQVTNHPTFHRPQTFKLPRQSLQFPCVGISSQKIVLRYHGWFHQVSASCRHEIGSNVSCPQLPSMVDFPNTGTFKKTAIDQKKLNMHWKPADQCFNAATHCFSKAGPNVVVSRQAVLSHNIEIGEPWAHGWLNVIARIQAGRLFFKSPRLRPGRDL